MTSNKSKRNNRPPCNNKHNNNNKDTTPNNSNESSSKEKSQTSHHHPSFINNSISNTRTRILFYGVFFIVPILISYKEGRHFVSEEEKDRTNQRIINEQQNELLLTTLSDVADIEQLDLIIQSWDMNNIKQFISNYKPGSKIAKAEALWGVPNMGGGGGGLREAYDTKIQKLRQVVTELLSPTTTGHGPDWWFHFLDLGNQLVIRDRLFGRPGFDIEEMLWAYDATLLLLKRESIKNDFSKNISSSSQKAKLHICVTYQNKGEALFSVDQFQDAVNNFQYALERGRCDIGTKLRILNNKSGTELILGHYNKSAADALEALDTLETQVSQSDWWNQDIRYYEQYGEQLKGLLKAMIAASGDTTTQAIADDSDGWNILLEKCKNIQGDEISFRNEKDPHKKKMIADKLYASFLVLYHIEERKAQETGNRQNYETAWKYLETSQEYKRISHIHKMPKEKIAEERLMRGIGTYTSRQIESYKRYKTVDSEEPVFIIGYPRSGTTLLERVLDAHSQIGGLGEHSVIANSISSIHQYMKQQADAGETSFEWIGRQIIDEMKSKWIRSQASLHGGDNNSSRDAVMEDDQLNGRKSASKIIMPVRFIDKWNMNFKNIMEISVLFPNAKILHVVRDPVAVCFSNYKHDFSGKMSDMSGQNVDFTSDFETNVNFYIDYRITMDYWESILPPGRISHIRYEDIVNDLEGVAQSLIQYLGLRWDKNVLSFSKKKHAVNTFSSTQVRKGLYSSALESWKVYEKQLQPMIDFLGEDYLYYHVKTNIPGYKPPPPSAPVF